MSSNLFLTNNNIIPKIWTLLYSFKPDSEVLNYLIENFILFERDIFFIIKNNFYDCLTETYQIENDLEFTEKMNFFFNEQSFLWRYIFGKEIEEKLKEEEYKSYENQIEKEISDLEKIKEFSVEIYNKYLEILNEQLEKIRDKIEVEGKSK